MNRAPLATDEYYHIYNRGVDKRQVFSNKDEVERFLLCMQVFNSTDPVLSLRASLESGGVATLTPQKKLVEFLCYCLNPNHYHFILKQLVDGGIAEFMKRLNGGYTWYFNKKHNRNGALFQGVYKSCHISDNEKLLEMSVYVNINNRVHQISGETAVLVRSSWDEYVNGACGFCEKGVILGQYANPMEYKKFALDTLPTFLERKREEKDLAASMLEDF